MDATFDMDHLLETNVIPTALERTSLLCHMTDLERQRQELQHQIESIDKRLSLVQSALSPIRQVPLEILGEIFTHVVEDPETPGTLLHSELDRREAVVNLGLVCKSWREAALLTRELWAFIESGSTQLSKDFEQHDIDRILGWLERAGNAPKSLYARNAALGSQLVVDLLVRGPAFDRVRFDCRSLGSLMNIVEDIEAIRAIGELHDGLTGLNKSLEPLPWDQVRRLELDFQRSSWILHGDLPESDFLDELPPGITFLSLHIPPQNDAFNEFVLDLVGAPDVDVPSVPLAISQTTLEHLTSLEFACDWEGKHLLTMLQHCKGLIELTSICGKPQGELFQLDTAEIVLLPNLKTLRLQGHLQLLRQILAPSLTTLDIDFGETMKPTVTARQLIGDPELDRDRAAVILQFAEDSGIKSSVTTLRLSNATFAAEAELKRIVLAFPHLSHLTLDHVVFDQLGFWGALCTIHVRSRQQDTHHTLRDGLQEGDATDDTYPNFVLANLEILEFLRMDNGLGGFASVKEEFQFLDPLCAMLQSEIRQHSVW